jgi:hypothetical protein
MSPIQPNSPSTGYLPKKLLLLNRLTKRGQEWPSVWQRNPPKGVE